MSFLKRRKEEDPIVKMLAMTSAAANLSVQSSASVLLSAQDR
jgi:hypothetical protein